jgi:LDH2 family malate/lactate/ureidoglycolate dehydrogenase
MAAMHLVASDPLEAMTAGIFEAAGTPADLAAEVARHLVSANLAGHDSHGVIRIPAYLQQIESGRLAADGRPAVVHETAATAIVDANRGFGQVGAAHALQVAIEKASAAGAGVVSIRRCGHIGRLGHYAETAAAQGFISMIVFGNMGPGIGLTAPFGGAHRHLGTNPWSFGVPSGETQPVVVDFATTVVAEGKVQVARAKHAELPPGQIVDKHGHPSTNPEDLYSGGMLLPAAGHKGYGLSLVAALVGAGLTAEEVPDNGVGAGVVVMAIDPRAFGALETFTATIDNLSAGIEAVPPASGFEKVFLPGGPEAVSRASRRANGVPIAPDTWDVISAAAAKLGVAVVPLLS